jgi:hypothetical protein
MGYLYGFLHGCGFPAEHKKSTSHTIGGSRPTQRLHRRPGAHNGYGFPTGYQKARPTQLGEVALPSAHTVDPRAQRNSHGHET